MSESKAQKTQGYSAEMNRCARRKVLKGLGIVMAVLLPAMLALWLAKIKAVAETRLQLHTFSHSVLDKSRPGH